jgi:hypothetical protein
MSSFDREEALDSGGITRSLDEANGFNAMEGFLHWGRFTCYHEEEDKWPPHHEVALRDMEVITKSIEKSYTEAARWLPLDQIPELADCIFLGAHCIGHVDPVSNIILNTIHRLPLPSPSGRGDDRGLSLWSLHLHE